MIQKIIITLTIMLGIGSLSQAQQPDSLAKPMDTAAKEVYFKGFTQKISEDRMIPPHGLEVTFNKTVHLIFPSAVRYVDLGSADLIAAKADGVENVIRVKAAVKNFKHETNFAVITDAGNFYTFNVIYKDEPSKLNIEMKDFIHDGSVVNRPNNAMEIYFKELGNESPKIVYLMMKSIHAANKKYIRHIGCKRFGIQHTLKGIYTHNGLLYFHSQLVNASNVPFQIDYISFKVVDKKVLKRTAIQEQVILPLRAYNYVTEISGNTSERIVFAMDKFTLPDDKQLVIDVFEKNGGRHVSFVVESEDIIQAKVVDDLKI